MNTPTVKLPYPRTLYDEKGMPVGMIWPDGSMSIAPNSGVGLPNVGWNEVTAKMEIQGTTTWDGAAPPTGPLGRGELLGDYAAVKELFRTLGIPGPGFKTASWGLRVTTEEQMAKDAEKD